MVRSLKEGDNNTFNLLYRKYYHRLLCFANSYVKDSFIAGNLVQDAFMALWENREKLASDTNVPSYLLTIVKNKALNHLNHLKAKTKVEENIQTHYLRELELRCSTLNACNPEQMFQADVETIIQRTIELLPERCGKIILLSKVDGLSNKEIAEKMNISLKGVEYHITRALKLLRENLGDYLTCLLIFLINIFS
ncbi:MAG: RNA polymerase sigma-70 factor [Bacteroidales bacterium]|nr:RNA polymerase sigma-70 factor [Bacteroidales bacterium]